LGIELDEGYVKTAVERWEKLTGQKAVLMDSGENLGHQTSHVGRLRDKEGVHGLRGGSAKKGDKIGAVRL
jgi:hypothetical protein